VPPSFVDKTKQETAALVARMLPDPAFSSSLAEELERTPSGQEKAALLETLLTRYETRPHSTARGNATSTAGQSATQNLRGLDHSLLAYKGVEKVSEGLLQVRLYEPAGQHVTPPQLSQVLVAYEPAGDDKQWEVVEAYDSQGNLFRLDAHRAPDFPVLVVDIDGKEDLRAGLTVANQVLQEQGVQEGVHANVDAHAAAHTQRRAPERLDTSKLESIRLRDDQEPWASGAAEVYALVSGIQPAQPKPQIELVDMPYLFYDNETYSPNQVLIYWSNYRFGAANVLLYEHDDNTNYKDLAVALASGVASLLGAFKPEIAVVATVAQALIQAMPSYWFQNNDDYIDSFYTLEKDGRYTDYVGAANNATITLMPFQLASDL
jgi:hypothetical protein